MNLLMRATRSHCAKTPLHKQLVSHFVHIFSICIGKAHPVCQKIQLPYKQGKHFSTCQLGYHFNSIHPPYFLIYLIQVFEPPRSSKNTVVRLLYTFFVFRSHWFACSVTFLSAGQFGFGVVGDAGFFVLLYVDRLHLLVPVLGTDLCGGSPWCLYLTTWFACLTPVWNKWPGCGRVGEEVKLGSRYSQLLTNT